MDHQNVLASARQGNAAAIALLINQALITRGVRVKAIRKEACLHVLLEGTEVPEQQIYTRVVYAATLCLGAAAIRSVQVYGQRIGDPFPAWTQALTLNYSSFSQSLPKPQKTQAKPVQQNGALPQYSANQYPNNRHKLGLSFAILICASFGLGAGLSYFFNQQPAQLAHDLSMGLFSIKTSRSVPTAASVADESPNLQAAIAPNQTLLAPSPNQTEPVITIKAVGDIIPGTNFPSDRLPDDGGQSLFRDIKPFLGGADIVFGNFESTMTDYPYAAKDVSQGMTFAFRTPPAYAGLLRDAGFNALNIANNHSMDFNEQGLQDTIANIEQAGMKVVGQKGQIAYLNVNGIPVALIGFSFLDYQNSMNDLATAQALVQEAKKQAKLVIVSVHEGAEGTDATHVSDQTEFFFGENRGNSVNFAHTMIDQGADLVLGHGPHVPRALELYHGKLIAYSLGNFMGYRTLSTEATLSDSLILQVQLNAQGSFVSGKIIPVALDSSGIPHLDDYFQSVILIRNLIESDFPVTPLLINDLGQIVKNEAPLPNPNAASSSSNSSNSSQ